MKNICSPFWLAILVSLGGCATALPNINSVDPNNLSDDQALLIVTTGASETCTTFSSAIVVKKSSEEPVLGRSIGVFQLNNGFLKSDFPKEYGRVYTTVLKPGEYDFWLYSQHPFFEYIDPLLTSSFTLKSKEIKYIGEIYSNGCGSFIVNVHDKSQRDLELIKSRKPDFNINNVVVEPVKIVLKKDKANH